MDIETQAYELAREGKSNASIMGILEISSGALTALLGTRPKIIFEILRGRADYIDNYLTRLQMVAAEEIKMDRLAYNAVVYCIERAAHYDQQLFVAHDVALIAGSPVQVNSQKYDPATVTQLLRRK